MPWMTRVTGITEITRTSDIICMIRMKRMDNNEMTWMAEMTGIIRMTGMLWMTGMTFMIRMNINEMT